MHRTDVNPLDSPEAHESIPASTTARWPTIYVTTTLTFDKNYKGLTIMRIYMPHLLSSLFIPFLHVGLARDLTKFEI